MSLEIFYLSFADDDGFRGVCLVEATDSINAVRKAHRLKINPSGEVMVTLVPRDLYARAPKQLPFNRLMDKETLIELGGPVKSLREMDVEERQNLDRFQSDKICEACNNGTCGNVNHRNKVVN